MAKKDKEKVKKRKKKDKEKSKRKEKVKRDKTEKSKRKNKDALKEISPVFVPEYEDILSSVERQHKLGRVAMDKEARRQSSCSTGLLTLDLVVGNGGLIPGCWATFFGPEQSAKSTLSMQVVNTVASENQIPLLVYADAEGSSDPNYIESMYSNKLPADELFGVYDEAEGKYVVKPRVRYHGTSIIETFFNSMKSLLNSLPDKTYENGKWWLVYENTKPNQKLVSGRYDKDLFKEHNKFYVPAPDPYPQALIVLDSYPAMQTQRSDDKEEGNAGMAEQARAYAENVKKIRGKLKAKAAIVVGVNQLRVNPSQQFGNPEYEPCGSALKFASDIRIKNTPRAVPHGKGQFEEEVSINFEGGTDTYRYIHFRAFKNKLSTPYLEGWARLWVKDGEGIARGYCPVYDTFQYLKMTGQITGSMKKMHLQLAEKVSFDSEMKIQTCKFELKKLAWDDFKALILLSGKDLKKHCKKLGLSINPKLRETCFKQLKSGKGERMYYAHLKDLNKKKRKGEEAEED